MMNPKFNSFDHEAMKIALEEAQLAFDKNEVPVGAALFLHGKLIATGHNLVNATKDATMHAEIICLRNASKVIGDFRLQEAILYCTLEPCSMCSGAMHSFRIKKVIWGAKDLRIGACGTLYNLFDGKHPIHNVEFESVINEEESANLLRRFFKEKREKLCKK